MKRMKLTVGLGALEAYPALCAAGADEMFAGFVPHAWIQRYGNITPLNRREVLMHGLQMDTLGEMQLLANLVEKHGVPVAITFNSIAYLPQQYPIIGEWICKLHQIGFQDWILADPALIIWLRSQNIPGRIHLSGEAGCFNPDAFRLFSRWDIHRYIFPRKMQPDEMAACIAAVPDAQYEAFVLNERCHFSGAFCSSLHCDELDHICHIPYLPDGPDFKQAPLSDFPDDDFGAGGCALCALPQLAQAGITHLKIVGRGAHVENLQRDIRVLRRALDCLDNSPAELRKMILNDHCSGSCYYPAKGGK